MNLEAIQARLKPDARGWNFYDDHPTRAIIDLGRAVEAIERLEAALIVAGVSPDMVVAIRKGS
jgi:hypothetical protein